MLDYELFGKLIYQTNYIIDIQKFAEFVKKQHTGQLRKDGSEYFLHCHKVSVVGSYLAGETDRDDIQAAVITAACLGHDLYEDTRTDFDDVVKEANLEVAAIISYVSDDKRIPGPKRHLEYIRRLNGAPFNAQLVKLADIQDNTNDSFGLLDLPNPPLSWLAKWRINTYEELICLTKLKGIGLCSYKVVHERLEELKNRLE